VGIAEKDAQHVPSTVEAANDVDSSEEDGNLEEASNDVDQVNEVVEPIHEEQVEEGEA
jgi:hypothetical protein